MYIVKLLCCGLAVFILDKPTLKTIDVFSERYNDFKGVENIENGWMYTSMFKFNKSALFPIINSNVIYAVEVSKSEPIFLKYNYTDLTKQSYVEDILIKYSEDEDNILFNYSIADYNYYGYIDRKKYNLESFEEYKTNGNNIAYPVV